MKLKRYIEFLNEQISKVDITEYNDIELYDLNEAGIMYNDDGILYIDKDTNELHITGTLLHENGVLLYDLTDLGHPSLSIDASESKLTSFKGIPSICNSFIASNNYVKNLIGGPDTACSYYSVNNCQYLTSLEGAPTECNGFNAQHTSITDCYGLDNILSDTYVNISNNDKLTSLKGLPENTHSLNITNCKNLINLEHIPNDIEEIILKGCSNLKTLYHMRDSNAIFFDEERGVEGTGIPKIEVSYFMHNKTDGDNYYESLFNHAKAYGINEIGLIHFPESFIKTLSKEDKSLISSTKTISKFKL